MSDTLFNVHELQTLRTKVVTLYNGTAAAAGDTKSTPIRVSQFKEATFFLDVTAMPTTGSRTFDVQLYTKDPVSGKWFALTTAFTQITANTGSEMKSVAANLGEYIAVGWTKHANVTGITFTLVAVLKV